MPTWNKLHTKTVALPERGQLCEVLAVMHKPNDSGNNFYPLVTIGWRVTERDWRIVLKSDRGTDNIHMLTPEGNIVLWRVWQACPPMRMERVEFTRERQGEEMGGLWIDEKLDQATHKDGREPRH